jgi:hypothetical protein
MFYAASKSGSKFIAKREFRGEIIPAGKLTYEKSEAFEYATAEEANAAALNMFRKDAGEAIAVTAKPSVKKNESTQVMPGFRPSRHQIEEAAIHGDHELYT